MPVTIHDVAERLNLSITTVSRALDGYTDVSESTRQRVIQTAHEMGYAPSRAARQLRKQKAEALGFILPSSTPRFADPSFLDFIAGLGDGAASQNYDLLISTAPPDSEEEQSIYQRWVQSKRVDGIVLSRIRLEDWRVSYLLSAGFPFVASGRSRIAESYPYLEVDGRLGMRHMVQHLVEQGHRRIAFIGGPAELAMQEDRLAGYQQGLAEAGLPPDPDLVVQSDLTRSGGYRQAQQLLRLPHPPTAIMGINDLTAFGVMRAAQEAGLVVGGDLAVTGFDGIEEAENAQPPLTTLNMPVYDTARRLVEMLMQLIAAGRSPAQALPASFPAPKPELIIRASSLRENPMLLEN